MTNTPETQPVTASLVPNKARMSFLPTYFGPRFFLRGETLVYAWLDRLSKDYEGGCWDFYTLSNGGFYMAPRIEGRMRIVVEGNGFVGNMSADAAGIVVTMFTLGQLARENFRLHDVDFLTKQYHFLREFVYGHAEGRKILSAID